MPEPAPRDVVDSFCSTYFDLHQITLPRQRAHKALLYRWVDWCAEFGADPLAIDDGLLQAWMTLLIRQKYKPSTVRFYLGMLKPFYRWAARAGHVSPESLVVIEEVELPRGAAAGGLPRPYRRAEIQYLWRAIADQYPPSPDKQVARFRRGTTSFRLVRRHATGLQMRAIVSLALYMGLRRNEIWTLSLDAMHPDNDMLVVHRKRSGPEDKVRDLPYTDAAREAVREWFKFRRWMNPGHQQPWLRLYNPDPTAPVGLTTFKSLLAGLGDGYEYHRLRHTCATERLRAGMPIEILMDFLGHASLQQTLVYSKIVHDDVERAVIKSEVNFLKALAPSDEEPKQQPQVIPPVPPDYDITDAA
jgi:integrase